MIPEEPASSTGTLSSLQNLEKELSFTDQLDKHGSWLYKLENLNIPHQVSKAVDEIITNAVDWAMQAPLRARFSDLPAVDMKEILQQRIFEDKSYEDHKKLYDALEKSLERDYSDQLLSDLEEARQKKRKRRTSGASGSSQLPRDQVRIDVNRPMPLGGPPGHVTIQLQFFFKKDLECLRHGSKESSHALSISKMKVASYPDFDLELLVPEQMWIEDVCTYDISAKYGISHWWFNRQKFYIDIHESPYDYLSEIVLRRADFQEHTITEKDFKNLHPSDFEDLNMLLLQGYEFKHDYTIIESPRAVMFPVNNNERKIMRVKEFKIKRLNPDINMRFWTQKDMTRSKEFIAAIERRLKTRRIYRNLECFVGGRVRDIDYRLLQRTE
nr:hypothetical protein [Tanacetum cinerariifolium]